MFKPFKSATIEFSNPKLIFDYRGYSKKSLRIFCNILVRGPLSRKMPGFLGGLQSPPIVKKSLLKFWYIPWKNGNVIYHDSLRHTSDFRNHEGKKGLFSKFHISVVFCPKIFRISAFESPGPIFCIFETFEHLRAFLDHLRAFHEHLWRSESVQRMKKYTQNIDFWTISHCFHRCSGSARKCSKNAKMQTLDQKLCNAPVPMCFWLIFIKITYLEVHDCSSHFFFFEF